MANDPIDPTAFFREVLGQFAPGTGPAGTSATGEAGRPDDLVRMFAGAAAATGGAQQAFKSLMERALSAANVPGRGEIEDLGARIARIEAALFRIEARLGELGGGTEPR